MNNPAANANPGDFEPDGTPYSMSECKWRFVYNRTKPGELDKVSQHGKDQPGNRHISICQGHTNCIDRPVMIYHDGNFYVGTWIPYPLFDLGAANIYKITPGGHIAVVASGFTAILGVTFDEVGGLYV